MNFCTLLIVSVCIVLVVCQERFENGSSNESSFEDTDFAKFVDEAEEELRRVSEKYYFADWNYVTNINDQNEKEKDEQQELLDAVTLKIGTEVKRFKTDKIKDLGLKRKLVWLKNIGTSALDPEKLKRFHYTLNAMRKIYNTAKVPSYKNPNELLILEPDIKEIFAQSSDPKELEYYWNEWHRLSGGKMRDHFLTFAELINEAARLNGFQDVAKMQTVDYESDNFTQEIADTWTGLKPLYEQLHAYVRSKLLEKYGATLIDPLGPIPAHLLGNMWAQNWNYLANLVNPYPDKPSIDVTPAMNEQGWTTKTMYQKGDDFFISLGLEPMREDFWNNSFFEHPNDGREFACHAYAYDFLNGEDFRIKHCAKVSAADFKTANHEMGHIQYYMSYRNLSFLHREGANQGFHEAVGDTIALSVGTATYYKQLGLIPENIDVTDEETNINILLETALTRVAFLPFGYLVDKYRWDIYSGEASTNDLNCHWVKLRAEIQGVAPPNQRNETMFDAGGKNHVATNELYVKYFTAFIYEFQFYRALCLTAGQYEPGNPEKPLHLCNFYGNKEAGEKLQEMLVTGRSKPWRETMEQLTGAHKMDPGALREYFAPLEKWLKKYNEENNIQVGWSVKDFEKMCSSTAQNN